MEATVLLKVVSRYSPPLIKPTRWKRCRARGLSLWRKVLLAILDVIVWPWLGLRRSQRVVFLATLLPRPLTRCRFRSRGDSRLPYLPIRQLITRLRYCLMSCPGFGMRDRGVRVHRANCQRIRALQTVSTGFLVMANWVLPKPYPIGFDLGTVIDWLSCTLPTDWFIMDGKLR